MHYKEIIEELESTGQYKVIHKYKQQKLYRRDDGSIKSFKIPFDGKFSIHNKNTWRDCYEFFVETMPKFELFFYEYEDFIKQAT